MRPRRRLLRVLTVVVVTLRYCASRAGRLIAIAWFPCLLESASRFALEWCYYRYPAIIPNLLLSDDFNPPTWLTAAVPTPWAAMAWAFILSDMADKHSQRGAIAMPALRWIRFELSPKILIAAAIFSAANVADGLIRLADHSLLLALYRAAPFALSDTFLMVWGSTAAVMRMALSALIMAWAYPIAGRALCSAIAAAIDAAALRRVLRQNLLRVAAVFFLLSVALAGLDSLLRPGAAFFVHLITAPPWWTEREAALSYLVDFPFSMLSIVVWAVSVGLMLSALAGTPQTAPDSGTSDLPDPAQQPPRTAQSQGALASRFRSRFSM